MHLDRAWDEKLLVRHDELVSWDESLHNYTKGEKRVKQGEF
jgi:hypothetical protein